jgi:hypothetical protein
MNDIDALEKDINLKKEIVWKKEMMLELLDNENFKFLFKEEFMEKGSLEMLRLINHESVKDKFILKQYKNKATAIGVVKNYIDAIITEGNFAEKEIIEMENYINEQRQQGNN